MSKKQSAKPANEFDFTQAFTTDGTTEFTTNAGVATAEPSEAVKKVATDLQDFAAISISFTWLGNTRKLSRSETDEAANVFDANGHSIAASKRLFNTKQADYRKLTKLKGELYNFWRENSLPYPEVGVRLFRKDSVEDVVEFFNARREEVMKVVADLEKFLPQWKEEARQNLGRLFKPEEYPTTLAGMFDVRWDFHNVNPPDYLMKLNPKLYEEEKKKMEQRFQEAVILAEQSFTEEFAKMVKHLVEKISDVNGEGKRFHGTTVTNLTDFFDRFKTLSVRSNSQLDKLVEDAKKTIKGVTADDLRGDGALRMDLAKDMKEISNQLDALMVDKPRRLINRTMKVGVAQAKPSEAGSKTPEVTP